MRLRSLAIAYMVFVAVSIFGLWTMLYLTDGIPEQETQPASITMHVVAELCTASMLLLTAVAMAREREREHAHRLFFLAMGMLVYTLIASPGYYMDTADWGFVSMFVVLMAVAVLLVVSVLRDPACMAVDPTGRAGP